MSIIKESIKKQENILSTQIKKELNLLPKILRQKKLEVDTISKEMVLINKKSIFLNKELDNLVFNIISLEKDLTSLIIKNDNIKSHQRVLINSINNEMPFDCNQYLNNNDKLKEVMLIFLNYENDYSKELSLILNNNELTSLLIGSYSYLKMLNNDFPQKYHQIKVIISNKLINVKELDNNNLFCLIINYIENIFRLLDNKEKINLIEQKLELFNQKKNEVFVKIKIFEENKKEKENYSNIIINYINELISLIEKYKILMRCSNTKLIKSFREKKNKKLENYTGVKLNISCPNNALSKKDSKEIRKTNNKISYINIDLTNIERDNIINKKTIESVDDIDSKIGKSISKKRNISNYNSVKDLEKDIFEHLVELKNNPLYSIRKSNKINNNNTNINLTNKKKIMPKNKILKRHNTKNIDDIKKKNSSNKNNKQKIIDKINNNENNIIINQTNTTMTYNNIIINNSNEVYKNNLSYDSNKKNSMIKNNTSSNYIIKNSPFKKGEKIISQNEVHKPGRMKLIPYLTQDYQFFRDNQRKSNESYIRRKTNYKEKNHILKNSPLYSPHKTKKIINIDLNYKNISPNLDNVNCNTELMGDKTNQLSYSKVSQKNLYINIKHNKTNLCNYDKNNYNKTNQKSLNKINVNINKKEKNVNNLKFGRKISPNKQSSSFLLNIINSEENKNKNNLYEKQKNTKITTININLDKCKNISPILKQRQYYDKNIKDIVPNNKGKEIKGNEINDKNMDNSLKNNNINININCHIIPFKKNKNNKVKFNYIVDKKNNSNNNKGNKTPKTNNNYKNDKNIEINISEIKFNNSEIVSNLIKKEINNFSFNKQDYKNHKKSSFKI